MNTALENALSELRSAWRFRWSAVALAWVVCIVGWVGVLFIPDQYKASARVFVDTETALQPLLKGLALEPDVDNQLRLVRQALLSRPHLEQVARAIDLDAQATTPEQKDAMIDGLRRRIWITSDASRGYEGAGSLYEITFTDTKRETTLIVVDELVDTFVADTLSAKREGSETAQRFLEQQIADVERRLVEAENRLAEFKRENVGLVPGEQGDYFQRLQGMMEAVSKAEARLAIAMRRESELIRQLNSTSQYLQPGESQASVEDGNASSRGASNSTTAQLLEAQALLDDLLLRFTDKHPVVIATREQIDRLTTRQKQEIKALESGDPVAIAAAGLQRNPLYQESQLALNRVRVEIAALRGEISDGKDRVAELQRLVNEAPEVEAEFARLNRDYDVTRANYSQLVTRLEKARISEEAEETGSVVFEVIDPPSARFDPIAPHRPLLMAGVLLFGISAGCAVAYLRHLLKPVFMSVRDVRRVVGYPVLGAISSSWTEKTRSVLVRNNLALGGALALLLAVFGAAIVLEEHGARLVQSLLGASA